VPSWAADGDILECTRIPAAAQASFVAERLVYESDGLRIVGFLAYPKTAPSGDSRLPSVIFNRGGNRGFGATSPRAFVGLAKRFTDWGYVLFASNYRGSPGSEGQDEFGGRDVNDVVNSLRVLDQLAFVDRDRIGMWGHSRGGMMTYIALTKTDRIKAAVIGAGMSDFERSLTQRPELDAGVAAQCIPNWATERAKAIEARSAVRFVDSLPMNVPILLVHGTADWRVDPLDSMDMARALHASKRPVRLMMLEGADHVMGQHRDEYDQATRNWFDRYVRDLERLPKSVPQGK
jgi:dipeptidyl aminopeptidase/acylaminoacyl peptidase